MNAETEILFEPTHYDLVNDKAYMKQEDGTFTDEDGNQNAVILIHRNGMNLIPIQECLVKVFKVMKWVDFKHLPKDGLLNIIADIQKRLSADKESGGDVL